MGDKEEEEEGVVRSEEEEEVEALRAQMGQTQETCDGDRLSLFKERGSKTCLVISLF